MYVLRMRDHQIEFEYNVAVECQLLQLNATSSIPSLDLTSVLLLV